MKIEYVLCAISKLPTLFKKKEKKEHKHTKENCLINSQWCQNLSRSSSSWVIDQNDILYILINNSRSIWSIDILTPFLCFSDNLVKDAFIFQKRWKKMVHKPSSILVLGQWGADPPLKDCNMYDLNLKQLHNVYEPGLNS